MLENLFSCSNVDDQLSNKKTKIFHQLTENEDE